MYQLNIITRKSNLIRTLVLLIIMAISLIGASVMAQEEYINTRMGAFGDIKYSRNFEDLSVLEVEEILKSNPEAYVDFKSARTSTAVGWLMYVGGTVLYFATYDQLFSYGWDDSASPAAPIIGMFTSIAGGIMILVARNKKVKAVNRYNRSLHLKQDSKNVSLNIISNQNGLGVALRF